MGVGGVGAMRLRAAAGWAVGAFPHGCIHLENRPARAFYERMGGRVAEEMDRIAPDPEVRYHWPDAAALAEIRLAEAA